MQQRRLGRLATVLTAVLGLTVPLALAAPPSAASPTVAAASASPPGANDWSCRTDRRHPQPVVLVNGTFETMEKNWVTMSPYLAGKGYCVFAFNYGNRATGPIGKSARHLRRFVNRVRHATDRNRVDLVGHSQGGMMPRYYLKFLNGFRHVDDLVGLAPSNHGTKGVIAPGTSGALPESDRCRACTQQMAGSRFLRRLNRGGDTVRRVRYTVIVTRFDEVVTPYRSQFLEGPRRRVTNVLLQRKCATDSIEHDQMPNDPVAQRIVLDALRRVGPARERVQPVCTPWGP
jgi:triacylglycerol esterase/lipase EstA (alpha/beta hydrolase family)